MPKSNVEQWLENNSNASSDYPELIRRIKAGEHVECVIETSEGSTLAIAEYTKTGFGVLFKMTLRHNKDPYFYSVERDFINFCEAVNAVFAKQDFLKSTRKMLEIAKNAAEFKAINLPLNTPQDVELLLALMDRAANVPGTV